MKKILCLLLVTFPISSMQLDCIKPEDKRKLALSIITMPGVLVKLAQTACTPSPKQLSAWKDFNIGEQIDPSVVFAPNKLHPLELYHCKDGFSVFRKGKEYQIEKWDMDVQIRNLTRKELHTFTKNRYFSVNKMDNGQYSLRVADKIRGGGPWAAKAGYYVTKTVCWTGVSVATIFGLTRMFRSPEEDKTTREKAFDVTAAMAIEIIKNKILETGTQPLTDYETMAKAGMAAADGSIKVYVTAAEAAEALVKAAKSPAEAIKAVEEAIKAAQAVQTAGKVAQTAKAAVKVVSTAVPVMTRTGIKTGGARIMPSIVTSLGSQSLKTMGTNVVPHLASATKSLSIPISALTVGIQTAGLEEPVGWMTLVGNFCKSRSTLASGSLVNAIEYVSCAVGAFCATLPCP